MTTWIVSDTHFFHPLACTVFRSEYKDVQAMNDDIIDYWKTVVDKEDTVIHLGDFAFGEDFDAIEKIVQTLPGNVTLVAGNHDTSKKLAMYSKYWKIAAAVKDDGFLLTHVPVHPYLLTETTPRSKGNPPRYNIHGHMHNGHLEDSRYYNANWDVLGEQKFLQLRVVKAALRVGSLNLEDK